MKNVSDQSVIIFFCIWGGVALLIYISVYFAEFIDYTKKYKEWLVDGSDKGKPEYEVEFGDAGFILVFFWPVWLAVLAIFGPIALIWEGVSRAGKKIKSFLLSKFEQRMITKHKATILTSPSEEVRKLINK